MVEVLTPRHEIWHEPGGDMELAKFYLPKGTKPETVSKAFEEYRKRWLAALEKEGRVPSKDARLILDGPYTEPVRSTTQGGLEIAVDLDCYFMVCWFDRLRPLLVTLEEAEAHREAKGQRVTPNLRRTLGYMTAQDAAQAEAAAKGIIDSLRAGEREREFQRQLQKQRPKTKK